MIKLLYSLPRFHGMFNDCFTYDTEGCGAAKYFLKRLEENGENLEIPIDQVSGYEIVAVANQKLKEFVGL